jgi:hypothetical protein
MVPIQSGASGEHNQGRHWPLLQLWSAGHEEGDIWVPLSLHSPTVVVSMQNSASASQITGLHSPWMHNELSQSSSLDNALPSELQVVAVFPAQ